MGALSGRHILLGISGGIAAYKSAFLCRRLKEAGADVWVSMTRNGARFITPLTMETLSEREVLLDMFPADRYVGTRHIDIATWTELVIVAPATANLIGKYAAGQADDLLTTLLISTPAPVMIAPAMNTEMYRHPATQENLATLKRRGVMMLEPGVGVLACRTVGIGRMAEPEDILATVERFFETAGRRDLLGVRILITAGPTVEPIDPVRILTNRSSGKMGYAVAQAATMRGAQVTLISGPTALPQPSVAEFVAVETSEQMLSATLAHFSGCDVAICVAAVGDWQVADPSQEKLSKDTGPPRLALEPTPDILETLGKRKRDDQVLIGFSLETDPERLKSADKLKRKKLDLLVANNPTKPGSEFGGDTNEATLISRDGSVEKPGILSKPELAHRILDHLRTLRQEKSTRASAV
ncbi:MAG: bifunctional phosphopantothenoylcysteine decarboxylase/phosphopantothenate--cysteine ligase CoaBC [candidate division Zixibacteria bacterium]|nr:bifunctional phosphopantothenoylcysteine decarboxylase/phosphopantothenate--cysteine ligase CoaBC [candidate division Zixibacteria bacterium]